MKNLEDGRREVALQLLARWRTVANKVDAPHVHESVRDAAVKEEAALREEILTLMGVDS